MRRVIDPWTRVTSFPAATIFLSSRGAVAAAVRMKLSEETTQIYIPVFPLRGCHAQTRCQLEPRCRVLPQPNNDHFSDRPKN